MVSSKDMCLNFAQDSLPVLELTLTLKYISSIDFLWPQELLLAYGEYPAKYRLVIWEFLLQIPHNSGAYQVFNFPFLPLQSQGEPFHSSAIKGLK